MKFILSLAALAAATQALNLSADADVATETTLAVEAVTKQEAGYNGPIVPEDY